MCCPVASASSSSAATERVPPPPPPPGSEPGFGTGEGAGAPPTLPNPYFLPLAATAAAVTLYAASYDRAPCSG